MAERIEHTYIVPDKTNLMILYGRQDENLKVIEERLDLRLIARGHQIKIIGFEKDVSNAEKVFDELVQVFDKRKMLSKTDVLTAIQISTLNHNFSENKTIIRSVRLISELKTFVYRNGRPDHMVGYHDDIIMALAMPIYVVQTTFKKLKIIENQTKAMLDSWVTVSNESQKTEPTKKHVNPFYTNTPTYDPKQVGNGNTDGGEYNWLFGMK